MGIKSAYSPRENKWYRKWPESISQHDIVYLSPPEDPAQGLPIGNGDIGALLWTESSKLIIAVNKCDTWDDSEMHEFHNWSRSEEEYQTSLRHCGRIIMDFNAPVFDLLYQEDFEARLDLAGASANLNARTPFSKVNIVSYASSRQKVIVICCDVEYKEDTPTNITVERWGSRTFAHWYAQIKRDPSIGLSGTETKVTEDTIKIFQKLRNLDFVMGIRIAGEEFKTKRLHGRAGQFELQQGNKSRFYIYLTAVTSENSENPGEEVEKILNDAVGIGEKEIREKHEQEWKEFWERSFISLPENYVENIWYLILYYAGSSSRGEYPPHFTNGLWGFNRDFLPWNFYFHWNMQYYIWPLHAANHGELAVPYYKYRYRQLPHAKSFAEKYKHKKGAFYADVADRNGYNDLETQDNNTPGAQIAMDFWRHYQYTGDGKFLREMAWPVILEVTRFYEELLSRESDGKYHIRKTQAYEGSPLFDDTITDIAMIKALLPAAMEAAELVGYKGEEGNRWKDIMMNMVDFSLVPLENEEFFVKEGEKVLAGGLGKGQKLQSGEVFAVGSEQGNFKRNRYADKEEPGYYGIPDPELSPVFPAGVLGLKDRNSELYKAAIDQVRLHPHADTGRNDQGGISESAGSCAGWCPYPIVLARLGLADDLLTALKESISAWQLYCQGFGHWGMQPGCYKDANLRWRANTVSDVDSGEKFLFSQWPFRHFYNEAMPIVCTAVNEMLIQSYDGIIRLCPAAPNNWNMEFKLAAANSFIINAEFDKGYVLWVCVESKSGNTCRMVNPWSGRNVYCVEIGSNGDILSSKEVTPQLIKDDNVIEFSTSVGNRYLITVEGNALDEWTVETMDFKRNQNYKKLGDAQLGLPRMF